MDGRDFFYETRALRRNLKNDNLNEQLERMKAIENIVTNKQTLYPKLPDVPYGTLRRILRNNGEDLYKIRFETLLNILNCDPTE